MVLREDAGYTVSHFRKSVGILREQSASIPHADCCFFAGWLVSLFLHALRFFLQGGLTPPPCTPRGATGTLVLLACTRFMASGWLDSCGAILHPASAFYGESWLCIAPRLPHPGEASPGTPSLLSSRFVASWIAVCIHFACRLLPQNSHNLPNLPTPHPVVCRRHHKKRDCRRFLAAVRDFQIDCR